MPLKRSNRLKWASNPLKWAAWGAFIGLALAAVRADYGLGLAGLLGYFVGGAIGGGFLADIAAFVRNRFIR